MLQRVAVDEPSRRRFTARSGEGGSAGLAGMDGVEPKPCLRPPPSSPAAARDNRKLTNLRLDDKQNYRNAIHKNTNIIILLKYISV
jgi:hypothetical protein